MPRHRPADRVQEPSSALPPSGDLGGWEKILPALAGKLTAPEMPPLAQNGYELVAYLTRLALPSAKQQMAGGNHEKWVEPVHDILTAMSYLAAVIATDRLARSVSKGHPDARKAEMFCSIALV